MNLTTPEKSRLTEHLVRVNILRFRRWIFEPGMLFLSGSKWWGDKGRRNHRHNGLDLHRYENQEGITEVIRAGTKVPLMYEGRIVRIIEDFLGYTVFAAHEISDSDRQLFTIYGHVAPAADILIDRLTGEGAVIACLSGTGRGKVPPHLHLSLAFVPRDIPVDHLTWQTLERSERTTFLDPGNLL